MKKKSFCKKLLIVLLVVLFVRVIGVRRFSSRVYAIIYEVKLYKACAMWYLKFLFLDNPARYECVTNAFNTVLQPTPYKVNSLVFPFGYIDKPEDLQILFNASDALEKAGTFYRYMDKFTKNSLLTVRVPVWKLHRRSVTPMFNSHNLEIYSQSTNKWSQRFVCELQTKADTDEVIDLWDYVSLHSLNQSIEIFMGVDPEVYTTSEKRKYFNWINESCKKHFNDRLYNIWLYPKIIFKTVQRFKGGFHEIKESLEFMSRMVCDRQKILNGETGEGEKNGTERALLDVLCDLYPPVHGEEISKSLKRVIAFFLGASYETSSLAICYTLLMLAMNTSVQNQLYQEINQVLDENEEGSITIEDVENMYLLDRCIKESLRMYPPVPFLARFTTAEIKLSNNEFVQKGTNVVIAPRLVHTNPELYENPHVWNPDNFLHEAVRKRHPYSFIPFSAGPRGCIGEKHAMLSMKIFLAMVLRKYFLTTDMTMKDMKLNFELLLISSNGWKVKLHTRQ